MSEDMPEQTDDHLVRVRAELRSNLRFVVVEAPAGTGKTHEAALLALDERDRLPGGSEVLLLAHTNAAIDEFRARVSNGRGIRVSTFDGFLLDVLAVHTTAAGLPDPLRQPHAARGSAKFFLDKAALHLDLSQLVMIRDG